MLANNSLAIDARTQARTFMLACRAFTIPAQSVSLATGTLMATGDPVPAAPVTPSPTIVVVAD